MSDPNNTRISPDFEDDEPISEWDRIVEDETARWSGLQQSDAGHWRIPVEDSDSE